MPTSPTNSNTLSQRAITALKEASANPALAMDVQAVAARAASNLAALQRMLAKKPD